MYEFFVQTSFSSYVLALSKNLYEKFARLTLMKLTAVLQYTTKQSRTWIDFVSAVGGNGGLFIGFSLVTILEFIWILIQLLLIFLKPQEIAR